MKKSVVFIFALWLVTMQTINAQSDIVPLGGTATGNGGTVTYTIGQVAVQSNNEGNTSISEGVQQPYEIDVVGVDNYPGITLNAVVYPNPTQGNVQLTIDNVQFEGEVKVFDANGKFLFSRQIDGENTQLDLSPYATGTYYIIVCSGKDVMKTFKVVKTSF